MNQHEAYPVIDVAGPPRERGHAYGTGAREHIARNVAVYQQVYRDSAGLEWDTALARAAELTPGLTAMDADAMEELAGIADGARQPAEALLALNARTNLMYPAVAECTTAVALPERTDDGHVLLVQNWDWLTRARDTIVVLRRETEDGLRTMSVLEAGHLGRGGINSAGLGSVGNFLQTPTDRQRPGVPLPFIGRRTMLSRTLADAIDALVNTERGVSTNTMLASADGIAVDLECTPETEYPLQPVDGIIVHANHFRTPGAPDTGKRLSPDSLYRDARLSALLARRERLSVETFMEDMRDHAGYPASICKHPVERSAGEDRTVASLIMDLNAGVMWLADGCPCEVPYRRLSLAGDHEDSHAPVAAQPQPVAAP